MAHGKLLLKFAEVMDLVEAKAPQATAELHGNREFHRRHYFASFLLGLFNPVVDSMQALCRATHIPLVQNWLDLQGPIAPSQFSNGQHQFDATILQHVFQHLLEQANGRLLPQAFGRLDPETIRIVDSTLWKTVARMSWATWRFQHIKQQALRLHVQMRILDSQVDIATITEGNHCERQALRDKLQPGTFYIGDRYFSISYEMLSLLEEMHCGYLFRIKENIVYEIISHNTIDPRAAADGCTLDAMVRLGGRKAAASPIVRMIQFQGPDRKEPIILITTATVEELNTWEAMQLYGQRWKVELLFRWIKCVVPCRHWFAESKVGVQIQIYLVLIQSLLLAGVLGHHPNKRQMEALRFYQMGLVDETTLGALLVKAEEDRRRAAERRAQQRAATRLGKALLELED